MYGLFEQYYVEQITGCKILDESKFGSICLNSYKNSLLGKTVYHGSIGKYKYLEPTSLDLGNALEESGWSLYTWKDYESAIGWGVFQTIKSLNKKYNLGIEINCINSRTPVLELDGYTKIKNILNTCKKEDKTFFIYNVKITSDMIIGLGHSSNTKNCVTIKNKHIKPEKIKSYELTMKLFEKYSKFITKDELYAISKSNFSSGINNRGFIISLLMTNDLMVQFAENRAVLKTIKNAINNGELQPGDSIVDFLDMNGLELEKVGILKRIQTIIS